MSDQPLSLSPFVDTVLEQRHLWVLSDGEEYVVVDSIEFESTDVMPLFSAEVAAKALCIEDWASYSATKVSVDDFFEQWLPSLDEDGVRVGLDWNEDLTGEEMDPFTLAKALADKEAK